MQTLSMNKHILPNQEERVELLKKELQQLTSVAHLPQSLEVPDNLRRWCSLQQLSEF